MSLMAPGTIKDKLKARYEAKLDEIRDDPAGRGRKFPGQLLYRNSLKTILFTSLL